MKKITKETLTEFINLRTMLEKRANEIYHLIDAKEIDSRMSMGGADFDDNEFSIRICGSILGEWQEDDIYHPSEYLWMSDDEILEAEKKAKEESEREARIRDEEEKKRQEEATKKAELATLMRLKEKYGL